MFLGKGVLKIFSKFTGEHPCQGAISKKVALQLYGSRTLAWCSAVNLLHIFRIPFPKNTTEGLLRCWGEFSMKRNVNIEYH